MGFLGDNGLVRALVLVGIGLIVFFILLPLKYWEEKNYGINVFGITTIVSCAAAAIYYLLPRFFNMQTAANMTGFLLFLRASPADYSKGFVFFMKAYLVGVLPMLVLLVRTYLKTRSWQLVAVNLAAVSFLVIVITAIAPAILGMLLALVALVVISGGGVDILGRRTTIVEGRVNEEGKFVPFGDE